MGHCGIYPHKGSWGQWPRELPPPMVLGYWSSLPQHCQGEGASASILNTLRCIRYSTPGSTRAPQSLPSSEFCRPLCLFLRLQQALGREHLPCLPHNDSYGSCSSPCLALLRKACFPDLSSQVQRGVAVYGPSCSDKQLL